MYAENDNLAAGIRNYRVTCNHPIVMWGFRLLGLAEWYEGKFVSHRARFVVVVVTSVLLLNLMIASVTLPVFRTFSKEGFDLLYNIVSPVFISLYVVSFLAFFYSSQRGLVLDLISIRGDMFGTKTPDISQPRIKADAWLASSYNSKWLVFASDIAIVAVTLLYSLLARSDQTLAYWEETIATHFLGALVVMLALHFGWLAVWRSQFVVTWFLWRMRSSVLKVDPFAEDQVGGLRQLERFLTWATTGAMYFASVFIFYLVYLQSRIPENTLIKPLYIVIVAYTLVVILSTLVIPIFLIRRKMNKSKRCALKTWDLQIKTRLESTTQVGGRSLQELIAVREFIDRVYPTMPMRWLRLTSLLTISSLLLSAFGLVTQLT